MNKLYLVALNMINKIGSIKLTKLLNVFKTPENIFKASKKELINVEGIGEEIATLIKKFDLNLAEQEIKEAEKLNIQILTIYDETYPEKLKNIYDPPTVLYLKGEKIPDKQLFLGIVGTRRNTEYGLFVIKKVLKDLNEKIDFLTVSGMAAGIDTIVHRESINNNIFTIAVLGYGFKRLFPFNRNILVKDIIERGCIISEYNLDMQPFKQNFPRRNRIISGLSDGVLVIEAGEKSGALITANLALEQGREVFAIPGNIFSNTSKGTNNLIKEGAKPVISANDIIEEFFELEIANKKNKIDKQIINSLTGEEKKVLNVLTYEKKHIDNISIESNIDITKLNSILTILELKGLIKQLSGKNFFKII